MGQEPRRNRLVVPVRQVTQAGGIDSLELIIRLLQSLRSGSQSCKTERGRKTGKPNCSFLFMAYSELFRSDAGFLYSLAVTCFAKRIDVCIPAYLHVHRRMYVKPEMDKLRQSSLRSSENLGSLCFSRIWRWTKPHRFPFDPAKFMRNSFLLRSRKN